jgi:uncharacterized membrane protein YeaQ/YmgE (transglycosylase-associated protein family)
MGLIAWIILGAIAGLITDYIMGERDNFVITIILGIIGGLVGGFIASALGLGPVTGLNIYSVIVAVVGACIVVALYRALFRRGGVTV